jgi:hypothetical protein
MILKAAYSDPPGQTGDAQIGYAKFTTDYPLPAEEPRYPPGKQVSPRAK